MGITSSQGKSILLQDKVSPGLAMLLCASLLRLCNFGTARQILPVFPYQQQLIISIYLEVRSGADTSGKNI